MILTEGIFMKVALKEGQSTEIKKDVSSIETDSVRTNNNLRSDLSQNYENDHVDSDFNNGIYKSVTLDHSSSEDHDSGLEETNPNDEYQVNPNVPLRFRTRDYNSFSSEPITEEIQEDRQYDDNEDERSSQKSFQNDGAISAEIYKSIPINDFSAEDNQNNQETLIHGEEDFKSTKDSDENINNYNTYSTNNNEEYNARYVDTDNTYSDDRNEVETQYEQNRNTDSGTNEIYKSVSLESGLVENDKFDSENVQTYADSGDNIGDFSPLTYKEQSSNYDDTQINIDTSKLDAGNQNNYYNNIDYENSNTRDEGLPTGSNLIPVSIESASSEGQNIDPEILRHVQDILLNTEDQKYNDRPALNDDRYRNAYNDAKPVAIDLDVARQGKIVAQFYQNINHTPE